MEDNCQLIPHRTTIQVKTHAQMILKKINSGVNVFDILSQEGQEQDRMIDSSASASIEPTIEQCPSEEVDVQVEADIDIDTHSSSSSNIDSGIVEVVTMNSRDDADASTNTSRSASPMLPPSAVKKPLLLDHLIHSNRTIPSASASSCNNKIRDNSSCTHSNKKHNLENISPIYSITSNGSLPPLPQSFEAAMRYGSSGSGTSPVTPPPRLGLSQSQSRGLVSIFRDRDSARPRNYKKKKDRYNSDTTCTHGKRKQTPNDDHVIESSNRMDDYVDPPSFESDVNLDNDNDHEHDNKNDNTQDVESAAQILLELSSCASPRSRSNSNHMNLKMGIPSASSFLTNPSFSMTPRPELACTSTESMMLDDENENGDHDHDGISTSSSSSSTNYYSNIVSFPPRFSYVDHAQSQQSHSYPHSHSHSHYPV